ncbi:hypothetical protein MATL_G00199000 [Megalops atlanticus]|uniref:Nitric oxide associated 1 n=1 Tax=Megalops atlanticus TaxID=7932 RepID=A0A9D3T588_MEGAT|nr:hypothetical protein MATL_G00199000 [Megalops atlanticus]
MQRLLQVTLRKFATCSCSRRLPVCGVRLQNANRFDGSITFRPGNTPRFRALDSAWTSTLRSYSGEAGAPRERRKNARTSGRYTSVEPEREEEFVFLDCVNPEKPTEPADSLVEKQIHEIVDVTRTKEKMPGWASAEVQHRTLELQLQSLQNALKEETDPDSCIDFHDEGFPVKRQRNKKRRKEQKVYGTPDAEVAVSDHCCTGCGAVMHCTVPDLPGYLPSEKYKSLTEENTLHKAICQRCHLLIHHQKALNVQMSKEEYRQIVRRVRKEKALVLFIVDLLDIPDSIIPDLLDLIGKNKHIVVLGNKVDLLPSDSENYLKRIKGQLLQYCAEMGISSDKNIKDVHLISAKTGYGIEKLITSLQSSWKYKGDVYLVGTTNAGKSTLFNTLLESDYCKSKASDVIRKATISPWPGTTLNLLKFPIINPTPYRMLRRAERLKSNAAQKEKELDPQELRRLQHLSKQGYLVGRVGRTFRVDAQAAGGRDALEFDPESLSFGELEEESGGRHSQPSHPVEFSHNELKDAHWLYDTPGITKEQDMLSLLTEQELKIVVPTQAITPRTFVLKPGTVLFLGALGRIDYLEGEKSCWFTVIASNLLPVHITSLDKADAVYRKHAGNTLLGVPLGGEERMRAFPPLLPRYFQLTGQGYQRASADIKFSSTGWVAVTGNDGNHIVLRAYAPEGVGLQLRTPPLLPFVVTLKGERIKKSPAYKTKKPQGLLLGGLSAEGAEKLRVQGRK